MEKNNAISNLQVFAPVSYNLSTLEARFSVRVITRDVRTMLDKSYPPVNESAAEDVPRVQRQGLDSLAKSHRLYEIFAQMARFKFLSISVFVRSRTKIDTSTFRENILLLSDT